MARMRVEHRGVTQLARDMRQIGVSAPSDMERVTANNARKGNRLATSFARESAGSHGKHYPTAFTSERVTALIGLTVYEYGPDAEAPQGGMSFEGGSRNQKPHLDLARSADIVGPEFSQDTISLADKWFWRGTGA